MKKSALKFAVRAVISAILIALLYRRVDLSVLGARLAHLQWWPLVLFFAILFLNTFISAAKWWLFLRADGIRMPLAKVYLSYFVAGFFTVLLPSTIGGDTYRVYDIARRGVKTGHIVASVFADRLTGFLALAVLGLLFSLVGWRLIPHHALLLLPVAVFGLLVTAAGCLYQQASVRRLMAWTRADRVQALARFANRFLDSMAAYRQRPRVALQAMALSFVFQLNVILAIYALALALRLDLSPLFFCVVVPVVALIEAIPISIYGLGLRDSGYMLFFTQVGHTREEAGALAILYVAATFAYSALGGLAFIFKRANEPAVVRAQDGDG